MLAILADNTIGLYSQEIKPKNAIQSAVDFEQRFCSMNSIEYQEILSGQV